LDKNENLGDVVFYLNQTPVGYFFAVIAEDILKNLGSKENYEPKTEALKLK
jgi:hypothetical protein